MGKIIDITGQKFGKLTVIENVGKIDGRNYHWRCICDCGNERILDGSVLRSGNTKSCGCGRYDGFKKHNDKQTQQTLIKTGSKFNKLTVLEAIGYKPQYKGATKNRMWYKCQCDCGNIIEISGNALNNNRASCGKCMSSLGEYQIQQILDDNNINYYYDSPLPELIKETGRRLRFDFIIYDDNFEKPIRFIEFDGRQHIRGPEAGWSNSDSLETIQERDEIKNRFCADKGYPLVRIPYTKINQMTLEDIMGDKYLLER